MNLSAERAAAFYALVRLTILLRKPTKHGDYVRIACIRHIPISSFVPVVGRLANTSPNFLFLVVQSLVD